MEEIWKDIDGFEGRYKVSTTGIVVSNFAGKYTVLKTYFNQKKYKTVYLYNLDTSKKRLKKSIHRLVAEAFIPNPQNKPMVNHKDGNKINNHQDNLEWCNNSENQKHAIKTGLKKILFGIDNPNSKLNQIEVDRIRELLKSKTISQRALARQYNVSQCTINYIGLYKIYK